MMVLQMRLNLRVVHQRPNVDDQLQQVRCVLPIQARVEVLLLFRLLQLLEQLALLFICLSPWRSTIRRLDPFGHWRLEHQTSCEYGTVVVALIHQLQNLLLAFGLHIDEFLGRLDIDLIRIECLHSLRVQFIEQPFIEPVADALNAQRIGDRLLV